MSARVAIVVTTWNRAESLRLAVVSALEQGDGVSVVVARSDGDLEAPVALQGILGVDVHGPLGDERAATRNAALDLVDSEFALFLDDDDLLRPGSVRLLVQEAQRVGADAIRCGRTLIGPSTLSLPPAHPDERLATRRIDPRDAYTGREVLTPSQTLFRREALPPHPFDERFVPVEDFVLGATLACSGASLYAVDSPLTGYRVHGHQSDGKFGADTIVRTRGLALESLAGRSPHRAWVAAAAAYQHLYSEAPLAHARGERARMLLCAARAARASGSIVADPMWWRAVGAASLGRTRQKSSSRS